ncbi:MAG: glycosyltransferase family 39 protein [Candidatus Aenigmarchaeota archaeon]|nr:glycosyltransferase family 39 protein [Candidatus Aenigmarchaeota archaeon]
MKSITTGIGFHEKMLVLLLLVFLLGGLWGLGHRSVIADEMQHTALPIFMYDFMRYWGGHPAMGFEDIVAYGMQYHTHYHIFTSVIHHPPLIRIPVLASFIAFGISEFSARLVSLIFGLIGIIFTYKLAMLITGDRRASLLSAAILALVPAYFEYSRLAMLEVPLLAMSVMVVYFFYRYVLGKKRRDAVVFGITLGLCMLSKNYGFVIVFPLLLYAVISKKYQLFRDGNMYLALFIAAIIAVPWFAFASVFPQLIEIPYSLSVHYSRYLGLSLSNIPQIPGFFLQQFSYVLGLLTLAAAAYSFYLRDKDDFLLLSLVSFYYIFFGFFITSSFGNFDRFVMAALPAFAILDAKFIIKLMGLPQVKRYGVLVIIALVISSLPLLVLHTLAAEIRYPVEDAVIWVLGNTPYGGGYIYTDYSQLFYFLKNDRNLSVRVGEGRSLEALDSLLNSTFASPKHESLGIENPTYYYLILRYPLRDMIAARPDFVDYVENGPCFSPVRTFGEERRVVVFRVEGVCR